MRLPRGTFSNWQTCSVYEASSRQVVRDAERKRSRTMQSASCGPVLPASFPVPILGVRSKGWPTRLHKLLSRATGPDARARAEEDERNRCISRLCSLIQLAQLPLVAVASESVQPHAIWSGVGHGLRARTLRRRVKDAERLLRYFSIAFGRPWPGNVGQLIEYLQSLVESGVADSSEQAVVVALALLEKTGWGAQGRSFAWTSADSFALKRTQRRHAAWKGACHQESAIDDDSIDRFLRARGDGFFSP